MTKLAIFNPEGKFVGMASEWDPEWHNLCYAVNCDKDDADTLNSILLLQQMFQMRLGSIFDTQFIMNHALYAEAELQEMLRELEGFKAWKIYDWTDEEREEHLANAKEEWIDVLHFLLNIAIALGMSSDEIFELYVKKNLVNHQRQDNGY